MSAMKDKLPCCGYEVERGMFGPVFWNPYNKVVQCHACGMIYELAADSWRPLRRSHNTVKDRVRERALLSGKLAP